MCAKKIPLVSMGGQAERRVKRAQTRERGPPSALAVFFTTQLLGKDVTMDVWSVEEDFGMGGEDVMLVGEYEQCVGEDT